VGVKQLRFFFFFDSHQSIGNVIEPSLIVSGGKDPKKNPRYGVDVLRMWVASVDYTQDVVIGPFVLSALIAMLMQYLIFPLLAEQVAETVRRIRNSGKFMLGNLRDFAFATDALPYSQLQPVDRYQLHLLHDLQDAVTEAYSSLAFNRVYSALATFLSELSSFYFVVIKDRLYADAKSSQQRRAAQTVLHHVRVCFLFRLSEGFTGS
jgi:isoleucyl-tRNA synthetase